MEHLNILTNEVYPELLKANLVTTKAKFSREWLERNSRYMAVMAYQEANVRVLKVLLPKLQSRGLYDLAAKVQRAILA